ncbi:DNA-directed RNA polymerase I subunit 1 [Euphorbia peplus]|nr:DNA-directed RNA polymerase I subunit 1 [Euphorbia peplus]
MNQAMIYERCGGQLVKFDAYISGLPKALTDEVDKFFDNFSLMGRKSSNLVRREDLFNLMKQKFLLSLAQPGEPVGVLAAQSVGEPSTQMTLNTFHLAGRGEMNVTLGIPRLQEILMTASSNIRTPIMTCPLIVGRTMDDAEHLADRFKKITVADIIETMEVSVVPFAILDTGVCRIYKLKIKLYRPAHYPKSVDVSVEDWQETLDVRYVRELEDDIKIHMKLLNKINGIKDESRASDSKAPGEADEDSSGDRLQREENDEDKDDDDNEEAEDLGLDAQKRKLQASDEMDYDDASEEEELIEGESTRHEQSSGSESEIDQVDNEIEINKDATFDEEASEGSLPTKPSKLKGNKSEATGANHSKAKSKKKRKTKRIPKDDDRAIFWEAKDMQVEVHFKFYTNEPHILLAEIAQKTAKKVYIQNPGKIEQCRVTSCKEGQVIYYGKDAKERVDMKPQEKESIPALHTTGVDFNTFWKLKDRLDVRYVYSNNIHAMLTTYGVEAARETIIREINHVFKSYGISVSTRHLSLIADYMTFSGGYRPMSRLGGIKESTSPLSKMSFETASKFIVEAALHGQTDDIQTPSARICLGLPVKVGTGSFDLMQKLDI